ncbi:MAG: hypothetical protein HFJ04_00125 [Lachnospiraceae bacterium]|nr:hypothetical protein [Lachnospiraceae bacterium]
MKNRKIKITAVFLAASFALSGCGEALYELTPEETAAIVGYASHTVAKFNTFQQDGEIFVMQEVLDGQEEPEEPAADSQETEEPATEQEDTETADKQNASDVQDTASLQEESISLGEALGLGGISAVCKGSSLCATYEKSDVFAVDAAPGTQLLVLTIELANQSGQDQHVDLLSLKPGFSVVVNGTQSAAAQTTILPNDLSTYQEDIAAGASNDTVLIFQIPENIQEVSDIQLKTAINGEQHTINL